VKHTTWGRSLQRRGTRRLSPFPEERPLRAALSRTRTAMYWSRCDERVANGSWTDLRSMILGARDSHPQAKKHLLVAWLLGLVDAVKSPLSVCRVSGLVDAVKSPLSVCRVSGLVESASNPVGLVIGARGECIQSSWPGYLPTSVTKSPTSVTKSPTWVTNSSLQ
jgi:hypothetical protein